MSFRTALSGLNAAQTDLAVTSNNIANANTFGFKQSRAEFADVFAVSPLGVGRLQPGAGVRVSNVAQQFGQGNIEFTGNSLDLAISGGGFFTLSDGGTPVYTRAGNFGANRDGFVVNPSGQRLQVFPPNANGGFDTGRSEDLRLALGDNAPIPTGSATIGTNLPANAPEPAVTPFDVNDADSYNHTTSLTVFDSLGVSHVATLYYVKTANPNEWQVNSFIDGNAVGGAQTLQYSDAGALIAPATGELTLPAWTPPTGAAPLALTLDLSDSTQFGEKFAVNTLSQDGNTTGRLVGIDIDAEGVVFARFTNGQSSALGQLAMTTFSNPGGLQKLGDNAWAATFESGQALRGQAGSASFGLVQSGALEGSNVELTEQLVNMITAQRNFQANAQMITTQDQVTQAALNIR